MPQPKWLCEDGELFDTEEEAVRHELSDKLKPCPFCSCNDHLCIKETEFDTYVVCCEYCKCQVEFWSSSPEDVILNWNDREHGDDNV